MRPGEAVPPIDDDVEPYTLPVQSIDPPWWVVVRYTDAAGTRWEFREPSPDVLAGPPRRLRRSPLQLWRPRADW